VVTVISLFGSGGLGRCSAATARRRRLGLRAHGKGEIATNAHVVTTARARDPARREVYVEFADGNRVQAQIVGYDPNADVALLQGRHRRARRCAPLPLGDSDRSRSASRWRRSARRSASASRCRSASISAIDRSIRR
jgi:S1-C subfamily serine protease